MNFKPRPVHHPTVDPEFPDMNGLQRATEAWRYSLLSLEYWLSPGGHLREWIRQMARIALLLAAPAFLVIPIITFVLGALVKWTVMLTTIAWKLILLPVLALIGMIVMGLNWLALKAFISSRR